ncbi:MAG: hypothetical protein JST04_15100 [Bdellovibrionales bacterium]|nr:hypothetical protein [Bdellovibrionales bacterium]
MERNARAELFRVSLLLSLGIGLVIADLRFDRAAALVLFGFYLLAALLQRWIMAGRSYDALAMARREAKRIEESRSLFYCGATLDAEEGEEEKTAVREILDPRRAFYRKAARYGLVALFIAVGIRFRMDFRFWDSLFVAGAIVIVISATTGHLLLALGLNALVVFPCILTLPSWNVPAAYLYLFSVCLTFAAHRFYEADRTAEEDPVDWFVEQRKSLALRSALLAVAFCVVGLVVDRLVPDPKPEEGAGETLVEKAIEANRALGKKFRSAPPRSAGGNDGPAATIGENTDAPASRISPEEARRMAIALGRLGGKPGNFAPTAKDDSEPSPEGSPGGRARTGGLSSEDLAKAMGEVPKLPSPDPETLARFQAELERLRSERAKREEGTLPLDEAKKILESMPKPKDGDASKDAQFARELAKAVAEADRKGIGEVNVARELGKGGSKGAVASGDAGVSAPAKSEPRKTVTPVPPPEPPPEPPPLISEAALKRLFRLLKFLAYLGSVIAAALFVKKLLARKNPEELATETRRKATPTERARLLAEVRRIERAKLSEAEEVVARYRVFLELMACLNFPKPESYPPHEFADFLRREFPKMDFPFSVVTEGFCDVYYGEWKLGSTRLGEFKTQHAAIFRKLL